MKVAHYDIRNSYYRNVPEAKISNGVDVFVKFGGKWEWYRVDSGGIEMFVCYVENARHRAVLDRVLGFPADGQERDSEKGFVSFNERRAWEDRQALAEEFFSSKALARRSRDIELQEELSGFEVYVPTRTAWSLRAIGGTP